MSEKPVHVYKATNKVDGKVYIGITINLKNRQSRHKRDSEKGIDYIFYRAIRKYGWASFEWEVLEVCENRSLANACEQKWIGILNSYFPNGYNMTRGGDGGRTGLTTSLETKLKLSQSLKERTYSEETLHKMSLSHIGKKLSDETKSKISEANRGRVVSDELRKKLSDSNLGKTRSLETRQRISAAGRGRSLSEETRKKISEANKGRTVSQETRQKLSAAAKRQHARSRDAP